MGSAIARHTGWPDRDPWSHRIANALVRNDRNQAVLEVAFVGPEVDSRMSVWWRLQARNS